MGLGVTQHILNEIPFNKSYISQVYIQSFKLVLPLLLLLTLGDFSGVPLILGSDQTY